MTAHLWKIDARKRCCRVFLLIMLLTIAATTGLQAGVTLQWDANSESDLAGYNLYRAGSSGGPYSKLNSSLLTTTSFTDNTIVAGNAYYYVCTAVNTSGLESGYSNQVSYVLDVPNDPPVAVDDSASTVMNYGVTVSVLANDTDPNGDALQVTGVTQGAHGSVTFTTTSVRYTPAINFFGTDSFSYSIGDGRGGTDTATVSVVIAKPNTAPNAVNDTATVPANTATPINVLTNDNDADGDTLQIVSITQPAHGSTYYGSSTVTYTPATDYTGSDSFTYMVADGKGGTDSATVSVTVSSANHPPVAVNDSASVQEDSSAVVNVAANDSDADGDSLTVSSAGAPLHGTTSVVSSTSVRYSPSANYNGSDSFNYTISDGKGGTATATVTVAVSPVNDFPSAHNDSASTEEDQAVTITVLSNDEDVDGDVLNVTSVGSPQHGVAVKNGDGSVVYTPASNFSGRDSFSYAISDGKGGTSAATVSVTVNGVNDVPSAVDDVVTLQEDTSATVNVLGNDSDPDGDTLSVSAAGQPQHGTTAVQSGTSVRYTPSANYNGSDSFTYTISDGKGGTATAAVTVTVNSVNDVPKAQNDSISTPEGQSVTVAVLANDSDDDGDSLVLSSVGSASHGTAVQNDNHTVTYTPAANYNGSDAFTYAISDGQGGTASALVNVTVTAISDAPVANDDVATTPEDSSAVIGVTANDTDADGDTLTVTAVTQPQHGSAAVEGTTSVRYTPAANYHGSDVFTYTVSDGSQSATAQVVVTVTSINDAPTASADVATTLKNQAVSVPVLSNDSDIDGDTLAVTGITQPQHGSATITGGTAVQYTPAENYSGSDTFSYTVGDGNGGTAGATVTITVTATNDGPTAFADSVVTSEDQPVVFNPAANDTDPDGDVLSVQSVSQPAHGAVTVESATSIRYTPAEDYNGTDSFGYTVADPAGLTSTATVSVTVTPVNDAPVAVDDAATVEPGQSVTIPILANDSDVDGDQISISSINNAPHGTATTGPEQVLVYTPKDGYEGTDGFKYTISDGNGGTASANVQISVTRSSNQPPEAVADVVTTPEDQSVTISVLGNDSDPDGDILSVSSVTAPQHGTATSQAGGTVLYVPASNYNGSDSFSYTLSDGNGGSATGTVSVTVTPVNDPPQPADDSVTVEKNGSVLVAVLANDQDPDGDVITVSRVLAPQNGTVVLQDDGQVLYTPSTGYVGSDSFQYEVSDGREARGAQVSVQVVEQVQQTSALVFPVTVDTGSTSYLSDTYVGVGLFNPGSSYETVNVAERSAGGRSLSEVQLADPLPPKGQTAFMTGELPSRSPDSVSLSVSASSSNLQGFFMVGDFASRRLDGVGAQLDAATTLYFPVVHESSVESTLIQLINPSTTETTWINLELHQANGKIAAQVNAAMAAGGSFMGTIKEIFGTKSSMSEGFVAAKATKAISGYEVVANQKSLASGSGRKAASSQRLVAPHFFADPDGGTSLVRVLNAGNQSAIATINVRNDAGETMAREQVTLPANQLTVVSASQIFNLGNKKPSQLLTGSIDISIPQAVPVVASLEFTGFAGKSSTAAPMVESGYEDTVFPQVAQTTDGSMYTGLAILNPSDTMVTVSVQAYTADGRLARTRTFDLEPRSRKIDLLSGSSFFGPDFAQTRGHLRVRSTGKVVSYAIFGDSRGEYLSTIEGQEAK